MKSKTIHHIVYSTKGGCGKTAFSLCLEVSDLKEIITQVLKNENRDFNVFGEVNYLLDLDFLGTSLMHCFGDEKDKKLISMQNLIFDNVNIEKMKILSEKEFGPNIFIVPAEVDEAKKSIFHVKRKHTPLLKYDEFRYEIKALQKSIELVESIDEKDKIINIIYDMPPNSDGYTEAFFEEVFKLDKDKKNENEVILYLIYNSDTMLWCNLDWLNTFFGGKNLRQASVVFVNNSGSLSKDDSKQSFENELDTLSKFIETKFPAINIENLWLYLLGYDENIRRLYKIIGGGENNKTLLSGIHKIEPKLLKKL